MSVGIGGGMMFAGQTPAVEAALRSIGRDDASGILEDPKLARAVAALRSDKAIAWGFASAVDAFEAQMKIADLQMKAAMAEFGAEDPELAAELAEMDMGSELEWMSEIDFDFIKRYVGPTSWETIETDGGFMAYSYLLSAESAE